jgi:hypothetical protein
MSLRISVAALFIYIVSASAVVAQENHFKCPNRTEYMKAPVSLQIATKPYYPQFKEYCQKRKKNSTISKEGPYILWGPNGEKLEEGQYVNGKKDGKWVRWSPSQILEDTWKKGDYIGTRIIGEPSVYKIDFATCVPHEYSIPAALGSTTYRVSGKESEYCKLNYSIEIERSLDIGQRKWISCSVPRSKKKLSFGNTQIGIDFSIIKQYCKLN